MVFKSDKNKLDLNKGYSILKNKNDLDYLAHLSNLLSKYILCILLEISKAML